ncbi:MAG: hypothetical protein EBS84_10350 [Proteobacteria bacterium]|nr:hypothetical protein [Verrucomicrobiota bacterium]NBU09403.1 hypothetical protein [Pseudomonadota bacterium]
MLWIKRNLFLVIGIAVSLVLLGGAGFYVYSNSEDNFAQDDELEKVKTELETYKSDTFPSPENIATIKSNISRLDQFMAEGERILAPAEAVKTAEKFSIILPRVIDELRRDATNAQVEIPPKFEFTFSEVKVMPQIPSYAVEPLVSRLSEIRSICGVLFKARIRALEKVERVAAFLDEKGPDLMLDRIERTNALSTNVVVTVTPYRVVFRGFSSDLAAVLNGFAATKEFIAVRQVDVDPASGALDTPNITGPAGGVPGMGLPGMGLNPGGPPPPAGGLNPAPPPVAPGGFRPPVPKGAVGAPPVQAKSRYVKVLDEKPLRVTLSLDVVKVARAKTLVPPAPTTPASPAVTTAK